MGEPRQDSLESGPRCLKRGGLSNAGARRRGHGLSNLVDMCSAGADGFELQWGLVGPSTIDVGRENTHFIQQICNLTARVGHRREGIDNWGDGGHSLADGNQAGYHAKYFGHIRVWLVQYLERLISESWRRRMYRISWEWSPPYNEPGKNPRSLAIKQQMVGLHRGGNYYPSKHSCWAFAPIPE